MDTLIERQSDRAHIETLIDEFGATAILGARQCGKTTLAQMIPSNHVFDLENPRDLARLEQPQLALETLTGLVVIDEIQRKPDLFPLLRFLIDQDNKRKFLILGSASRDLICQSSETLAGRIAYYHLGGFRLSDIPPTHLQRLWLQGQYPRAYCAGSAERAFRWLDQYVTTFLERDIPQLGFSIPAQTLNRFWHMLSHYHGQLLNYSELAGSFGISDHTVRRYIEILSGTFMIRVLQPWHTNIGKRLTKKPKIYLRDSGLFHCLQSIRTLETLQTHHKLGASWEGFALETVIQALHKRDDELYFWRTHTGNEIDLFWQAEGKHWGVEFKYADAPKMTKAMTIAARDLNLAHLWIVYPGQTAYALSDTVSVLPLQHIKESWAYS
ncbi:ATP-binding protein [Planctomycetota bacterium]